ncbi:MAG: hypothetical protein OEU32_00670 [Acidimicrobiia bacterium]|nr:hypothetical protein [Acidimicrobiia bacterium]
MSRSRRRQSSGAKTDNAQQGNGQRRKGKSGGKQKITARTYWGGHSGEVAEPPVIVPSIDPAAVVRSLGTPPLSGHDTAADAYFAAVYEKAVGLSIALAAAGDLLASDDD